MDFENERVFQWRRKSVWRQALREMFPDVLSEDVLRHIRKNPPEFFVDDDLSWLTEPAELVAGFDGDLFIEFENRFPARFHRLRAIHGGRPMTWESYRCDGLRLGNTSEKRALAIEVFGDSPALVRILTELEERERAESYTDATENRIFFVLDRKHALRGASHYAKYGSEHLLAVAARLGRESALLSRGIPTLVHVNIPYFSLDRGTRREFMGTLFENFFCRLCGAELQDYNGLGFGFAIRETVPPEQIVRIEKAADIRCRR